jgi:hypothetical protein
MPSTGVTVYTWNRVYQTGVAAVSTHEVDEALCGDECVTYGETKLNMFYLNFRYILPGAPPEATPK